MIQKIINFIGNCARSEPLILILRDLHLSDVSGLDLFLRLVNSLANIPLLVIGEIRLEECSDEISQMLEDGMERGAVTVIPLRPLPDADIRTLATSILGGGHIPEELYARILETSKGIPLFTEEILRMMIQERVLRRRFGGWSYNEQEAALTLTPMRVREVMRRRVDKFPLKTRRILQFLAVFGHPIETALIQRLFPNDQPGCLVAGASR